MLKAYDVPQASRTAKGQAIVNFLQLTGEEKIASVLSGEDIKSFKYLVMVTKNGIIKKVELEEFQNVRRSGLIAIKLKPGDRLRWVKPSSGKDHVMLVTANGQSIRFDEDSLRGMGRNAAGVRGMRLKGSDEVVGMDLVNDGKSGNSEQILCVMSNGFGKRSAMTNYKLQGRGGSGIRTAHVTDKTGKISAAMIVDTKTEVQDLIVISAKGQVIRLPMKSVSVLGRDTQGVRIMKFNDEKDFVSSVTLV
jgi:DNA gyrase subunit A